MLFFSLQPSGVLDIIYSFILDNYEKSYLYTERSTIGKKRFPPLENRNSMEVWFACMEQNLNFSIASAKGHHRFSSV